MANPRSAAKQPPRTNRKWRSWYTGNAHLDFDEAVAAHKFMADAVQAYAVKPRTDQPLREAWLALVGEWPDDQQSIIVDAINWTIPPDIIPLMRWHDSVAAGFALGHFAAELAKVNADNDFEVRAAARAAWDAFEQRRLEANEVEEGFGCDKSASWATMRAIVGNVHLRAEQRVISIAQLAGRMFKVMRANMIATRTDDPEEVVEATVGGDPERLLPSELALLANPDSADQTAIKILERRALQYKYQGISTKGRGPMVLLIDESGSMHDEMTGYRGRNTWAKACAIALARIAWQEGRAVRSVHFGTSTVVRKLPKDDHAAMFEMSHSFLSGGTDFEVALKRGIGEVGNLKDEGLEGADIVIITDGEEPDHDAHNTMIDEMDAKGIRLWTVGIGVDISEHAPVRARAAKYVYANDAELAQRNAERLALGLQGAAAQNPQNKN